MSSPHKCSRSYSEWIGWRPSSSWCQWPLRVSPRQTMRWTSFNQGTASAKQRWLASSATAADLLVSWWTRPWARQQWSGSTCCPTSSTRRRRLPLWSSSCNLARTLKLRRSFRWESGWRSSLHARLKRPEGLHRGSGRVRAHRKVRIWGPHILLGWHRCTLPADSTSLASVGWIESSADS